MNVCLNVPVVYLTTINGWCGYVCEQHRYPATWKRERRITAAEACRHCEHGLDADERVKAIKQWEEKQVVARG